MVMHSRVARVLGVSLRTRFPRFPLKPDDLNSLSKILEHPESDSVAVDLQRTLDLYVLF